MNNVKFVLFSGKGGVGKTTMAASSAVAFSLAGKKTLLFSTDPAHSLSDSLAQKIGESIMPVRNLPNLFAVEQNSDALLRKLKDQYSEDLVKLLASSTYLDEEDAADISELAVPGLDELIGLKQIVDYMEDDEFDVYVWDTAPTGHTLRLLEMPDLVDGWVKILAQMRWKYRTVVGLMGGLPKNDASDDFLLNMKKTIKKVNRCLRDQNLCRFVAVTIPEMMAVNEVGRMIGVLKNSGIPVRHLAVNNIVPENTGCEFCEMRKREQQRYLEELKNKYPSFVISEVSQRPYEIYGVEKLGNLGSEISCLFSG